MFDGFWDDIIEPTPLQNSLDHQYFILFELKFIYSEKATYFCEIWTVDFSYVITVKSMVEMSQNFMAFSEYINFTCVYLQEVCKSYILCSMCTYYVVVNMRC